MSVTIQTGNSVAIQTGNRVIITAPGPQGPPGSGGGGSPGGLNTQVQFNDGGSFGGDAGLTYNKTTDTLTATNLTVSGLSTLAHIHGSLAGNLYVHVKNASGVTIAKGTPVYATGSVGTSGEIEVAAADFTNSAKMPAIGITDAQLIANAEGNAVVVGEITGLATNTYTINQELFVGTAALTGTLPTTGEVQSVAIVSRVHASTGIIVVNTQARLNAALRALANSDGSGLTALNASNITSGSLADVYIASAATWNAKQDAGSYITALTGDVTASGPGSASATLANTAVTPGSYTSANITVDSKGRVTAAANGSAGDMTKAVYDQRNTGFISGKTGIEIAATGGIGGTLQLQGGDGDSDAEAGTGGNGGDVLLQGANSLGDPAGSGGSIISIGHNGGNSGGTLNMSAGATGSGGNINTNNGGGSIDTTGTGSIGLGAEGTRTTLTGAATEDRAIALPDASGTVALTSDITGTNSGTNTGDVTLAGTPDYITLVDQVLTRNAIDLAADVTGILPIANIATGTPDGTKFVRDDGTLAVPAGGGGLTNITETLHTASPNNTVNAEQLEVTGGTTNVDLVLTPKGTGAFILGGEPDGSTPGGNKRGVGAVDMQLFPKNASSRVASGTYSLLIGGQQGTASGENAAVVGGLASTASGLSSSVMGGVLGSATATQSAVIGGSFGSATAVDSVVIGGTQNITSGDFAVAIGGAFNTASGNSAIVHGRNALAPLWCQISHAAAQFSAKGDAQYARYVLNNKTTTNSAVTLFLDGNSIRLTIPSGKIFSGTVNIVGTKSDGTAVARYLRQVTIKNVAGTTSLVGSVITLGTDEAAGTSISITADDTNDALSIQVTGITSETWRWVATVQGAEVAYGN